MSAVRRPGDGAAADDASQGMNGKDRDGRDLNVSEAREPT